MQAAILTGDLIGSTGADAQATEAALAVVADAARATSAWDPAFGPPRFTRFRGDGWQFAAPLPLGPRAALYTLARLIAARGLQSRIALGLGEVAAWGRDADLSAAHGPALTASGRALDGMAPGLRMALAGPATEPRDAALMTLWTALALRWSPEQAEALALALPPDRPRQTEIAATLGISPQAVSQRLKGAEAEAVLHSLRLWETTQEETP